MCVNCNDSLQVNVPTGPAGATGAAATISIGTTTTGAPGSSATVTNVGTSSAAVFNFSIPQGTAGAAGTTGATGAYGGVTYEYKFSTTTASGDPGAGYLRVNSGTYSTVSACYISSATVGSGSILNLLGFIGTPGSAVKGFIKIFSKADPTQFAIFKYTAASVISTTHANITITQLAAVGGANFTNNQEILVSFLIVGDKGDKGDYIQLSTEAPGVNCSNGGVKLEVLNGATGVVDPAQTKYICTPNAIPVGTVIWSASSTVPAGFLECDGTAISRTTYSALFASLSTTFGVGNGTTTFNLPDLRGQFIRGWSHGSAVDSGRSFGTTQTDAFKAHTHTATVIDSTVTQTGGTTVGSFPTTTTTSITTSSTGGTETRPTNVALMAIIKY